MNQFAKSNSLRLSVVVLLLLAFTLVSRGIPVQYSQGAQGIPATW